jgi:hypothetical protein
MQEESWKRIDATIGKLIQDGIYELTLLVVGSVGVGCSSTVNSLLSENVADVRSTPTGIAPTAVSLGASYSFSASRHFQVLSSVLVIACCDQFSIKGKEPVQKPIFFICCSNVLRLTFHVLYLSLNHLYATARVAVINAAEL